MKYSLRFLKWNGLLYVVLACVVASCTNINELSVSARKEHVREYMQAAEKELADGDFSDAGSCYENMAEYETERRLKAKWCLQSGDCYMKAKKGYHAFKQYDALLTEFPLDAPRSHVIEQLRILGEGFVTGEYGVWHITDMTKAIETYELIGREAPAEVFSRQDRYRLAELLQEEGRKAEAVAVYQAIVKSDMHDWIARARLALLLRDLSRQADGDGARMRAAMREAKLVLQYDPKNEKAEDLKALVAEADEQSAARLLKKAKFYLNKAHYSPAGTKRYLKELKAKYPNTKAAVEADVLLELPVVQNAK